MSYRVRLGLSWVLRLNTVCQSLPSKRHRLRSVGAVYYQVIVLLPLLTCIKRRYIHALCSILFISDPLKWLVLISLKRTFYIELSVNNVTHDGGVVQMFDRVLSPSCAGEQHPSQTQVLPGLGMKQDFHLLHFSELGTHFCQERLLDVVIEPREGHLFEGYGTHIELIELRQKEKEKKRRKIRLEKHLG